MLDLARVRGASEHPAEHLLRVEGPPGRPVSALSEFRDDPVDALPFEIEGIRRSHVSREGLVDLEELVLHLVADPGGADREPLLGPPGDLVRDARRRHLALVLPERHEDDRDEPPRRRREVDVLPEGDEFHFVPLQGGHEAEEVGDVPRDAVQARDHDHVDHPRLGQLQELLVGGPVRVLADLPVALAVLLAFDELLGDDPVVALLPLVVDEAGQSVELRVDRAVLKLRLLVGRDPDVEGDVDGAGPPGRFLVLEHHHAVGPPFICRE